MWSTVLKDLQWRIHFILCKGVAVLRVFAAMCICTSRLMTVSSSHDDGEAGVHEALFPLSLVHCSGAAIVLVFFS